MEKITYRKILLGLAVLIGISLIISGSVDVFNAYFVSHEHSHDYVFLYYDNQKIGEGFNQITNIGLRLSRNLLGFNNATAIVNATKWISAGNATVAVTLTKLTTEASTLGFTRALGTVTQYDTGGFYGFNVTVTFTCSGTINLNAFGLQWSGVSGSDNNLFSAVSTQTLIGSSSITVYNTATVKISWLRLEEY